jgi:cyclopropane-fatty-acyl-phospholipid synthase
LLERFLHRLVCRGTLNVRWPGGGETIFGDGGEPRAGIHYATVETIQRVVRKPGLGFGESYMDGAIATVDCDIRDVLAVLTLNQAQAARQASERERLRRTRERVVVQANTPECARRNVAHHYDLDGRLYSLFLDEDRQYSCAYFPTGTETLEQAQAAKKRHIALKLKLDRPGLKVLDIGCGWGGMALTLARDYGAEVTGITLSEEQLHAARERAERLGLAGRVRFELLDYRAITERYDRVVSVGMFEHVGRGQDDAFFAALDNCLDGAGVALLHTIGRSGGPAVTNPWLEKYIFPGGYAPALSEVLPSIEASGLIATDIEVWRLHYARTLELWRQRFDSHASEIEALYDKRFLRMFEFYLAGSEMVFRYGDEVVFQIQLAKRNDLLPTSRNYMIG